MLRQQASVETGKDMWNAGIDAYNSHIRNQIVNMIGHNANVPATTALIDNDLKTINQELDNVLQSKMSDK